MSRIMAAHEQGYKSLLINKLNEFRVSRDSRVKYKFIF